MRPRPWAPEAHAGVRRSRALILFALPIVLGACISAAPPQAPTPVVNSFAPVTAPPTASVAPSSAAPSTEPSTAPTEAPTPTPTPAAASPSASGSGATATAAGCTGSDDNRAFFAGAAAAYGWPVYCPVLPSRWHVVTGSRKSGMLEISYAGPDGARLELHEGAFCAVGADCVPAGSEAGSVAFGDRMTTLIHTYDGRLAAAVDRGKKISWMAVGTNLDDTTFGSFLAALIRLD